MLKISLNRCESANEDVQICRKSACYASHLPLLITNFMGDSYSNNQSNGGDFQNQRQSGRNNFRGGRGSNSREGGFRIRLSDNELRAARTLQEAFNLRSTVAVLGFALRTLAQMLEDGVLENFVNEYRSQSPSNDPRRARGERATNFNDENKSQKAKPNPFARPEKPSKEQDQKLSSTEKEEGEEKPLQEIEENQNDSASNETSNENDSANSDEMK